MFKNGFPHILKNGDNCGLLKIILFGEINVLRFVPE